MYVHTFPNGKKYVGITNDISTRWNYGYGYEDQPYMWYAICKYGWDNVQHEIIAENLTREEACALEIATIAKLKSNDPKFGYNLTSGGEGYTPSEETKRKISEAQKGKRVSAETRKKQSIAAKRRSLTCPPPSRKGCTWTMPPEIREKCREAALRRYHL